MTREFMIFAIDFDGCIAKYDKWEGVDVFGEPVKGAVETLQMLHEMGHKIIIHTCRVPSEALHEYLGRHSIPYDEINENIKDPKRAKYDDLPEDGEPGLPRKIYADVYIDDRGVPFDGNWENTKFEALGFIPWRYKCRFMAYVPEADDHYCEIDRNGCVGVENCGSRQVKK